MVKKAVFLDRDGVINIDYGYVHTISDFTFCEGIFTLSRKAIKKGYDLIVVTNQAGIARGYYTENDFLKLSSWMCGEFKKNGAPISKVYFSPTHPTKGLGKYKVDDSHRKPGPGMILDAAREFKLALSESILIGDNKTDIVAGVSAGVGCNILIGTDTEVENLEVSVQVITSLSEAEDYL